MQAFRKLCVDSVKSLMRRFGADIQRYPRPAEEPWKQTLFRSLLPDELFHQNRQKDASIDLLMYCAANRGKSSAQLFQDLFVAWCHREKKRGFFVEFGATDGVNLSNSRLLETQFEWQGILAEPARCWHKALYENRKCRIDRRCVYDRTGLFVDFNEVATAELSTVNSFSDHDHHSGTRQNGTQYTVETVALEDLLRQHNAPRSIDYLSIDTEGSELRILEAFDFTSYRFGVITVEHNFTTNRELIADLLARHGYVRVFTEFSHWDDWYVHEGMLSGLEHCRATG